MEQSALDIVKTSKPIQDVVESRNTMIKDMLMGLIFAENDDMLSIVKLAPRQYPTILLCPKEQFKKSSLMSLHEASIKNCFSYLVIKRASIEKLEGAQKYNSKRKILLFLWRNHTRLWETEEKMFGIIPLTNDYEFIIPEMVWHEADDWPPNSTEILTKNFETIERSFK